MHLKFTKEQKVKREKVTWPSEVDGEKTLEALAKYSVKLDEAMEECGRARALIRSQEEKLVPQLSQEIAKYSNWSNKRLRDSFRDLAQLRVVIIQMQQDVETTKIALLNARKDQLQRIVSKIKSNAPCLDIYRTFFIPPKFLIGQDRKINSLSRTLQVTINTRRPTAAAAEKARKAAASRVPEAPSGRDEGIKRRTEEEEAPQIRQRRQT